MCRQLSMGKSLPWRRSTMCHKKQCRGGIFLQLQFLKGVRAEYLRSRMNTWIHLKEHITVPSLVASRCVLHPLRSLPISSLNTPGSSNACPWGMLPSAGPQRSMAEDNGKAPVTFTGTGWEHQQRSSKPRGYLLSCLPTALQDWITPQNDHRIYANSYGPANRGERRKPH